MNKFLFHKQFKNINTNLSINNIAIIICNYTDYDIGEINLIYNNINTYYITNNNQHINNIKVINEQFHSNDNKDLMIEKFYKTQLLNIDKFNHYKYIVWIDKNVIIKDINNLYNSMIEIIKSGHDIYVLPCKNIKDEHHKFSKMAIYDNQKLLEQVRKNTTNKIYNLFNTQIIIYKNCPKIKHFMNKWWEEINNYSLHDGISFTYVLHLHNINYRVCDIMYSIHNINTEMIDINTRIHFIDNILWINLDRSQNRKKYMENLLININNTRISAIDGNTYNHKLKVKNLVFDRREMSNYEIACTLSHLKAAHYLKNIMGKYFMICEDDISFNNIYLFDNNLKNIIENAPDFDILMLFKFSELNFTTDYTRWSDVFNFNIYSTASYIISRSGIDKICSLFHYNNDEFELFKPLDVADIFIYKNLNTYIYKYNYISVLNNESTIHPHHLKMHKKYTETQYNMIYN